MEPKHSLLPAVVFAVIGVLLDQALENARAKAEKIAASSNRTLGKIIAVRKRSTPGGSIPLYAREAGGGADLRPGSATAGKIVTVTFALS